MAVRQGSLFGVPEGRYVQVALDTPVRREFSYLLPDADDASGDPEPGCRVRVPFGSRSAIGVVVGVGGALPPEVDPARVRPIQAVLDEEPLLTPALLRLGKRMAADTWCSWGRALAAMLPLALRHDRPRRTIPVVERTATGLDEAAREKLEAKFPKQARALAVLEQAGGPMELREFHNRTGLSRSPLDSLAKKDLIAFGRKREVLDPFAGVQPERDRPPELNAAQAHAVAALDQALASREHRDFLLFGITGSGKTEVYLHALETALAQGRGGIVLVPEIALTPQTVARFRARCGEVAVLHSGLTDAERHDQWRAIREGRVRVVVGARSALFAPLPELGVVVVDEEHESSFKQETAPRYHAREVARERARLEGAVCILGSATPALESWAAAHQPPAEGEAGMSLLELPERVAGGSLPPVEVVDLREQKPEKGHWMVLSPPLQQALGDTLARGERAILFLNQRGFAPAWHCRNCGGSVHCPTCDVALTYHRWRKKALCHYCMREEPPPAQCPHCRAKVELVGVGTERAEESVKRLFPSARIARMDRDTMLRRESYEEVLGAFGRGELDILLGTQMVAKGLDFPEVTLVGVLNADTALHHPDFRASERCFNLISQVAGRAGRSERGGKVVVQSWMPEHSAIQAAVRHDYVGFATAEMEERRVFRYPPFGRVLRLAFEHEDRSRVEELAKEIATELWTAGAAAGVLSQPPRVQDPLLILGPSLPPVEKLRGRFRRQILVKGTAKAVHALDATLGKASERQGVTIDPL